LYKVNEIKKDIPLLEEKVKHICYEYKISSDELLIELIRFLDLIYNTDQKLSPSYIIDLAWHEFILFTKYYEKFCLKHYGRFIHHTPGKKEEPEIFNNTIKQYIKVYDKPNPKIWGELANQEWEATNCGSCHN